MSKGIRRVSFLKHMGNRSSGDERSNSFRSAGGGVDEPLLEVDMEMDDVNRLRLDGSQDAHG